MWTNLISAINLGLLLWGRSLAKVNLTKHIQVVSIAMLSDVVLVAYLAIGRSALSKIDAQMPPLLMFHVALAIVIVALYGLATHAGWNLKNGQESMRPRLQRLDKVVIPLRVLLLITSIILVINHD